MKFYGGLPKKSLRSDQPLLSYLLKTISPLKMAILKFAAKHQWFDTFVPFEPHNKPLIAPQLEYHVMSLNSGSKKLLIGRNNLQRDNPDTFSHTNHAFRRYICSYRREALCLPSVLDGIAGPQY